MNETTAGKPGTAFGNKFGQKSGNSSDEKSGNKSGDLSPHKKLARQAALESIVLLKNEALLKGEKVLPLNNKIHSIAVIGVDAEEARLGGYSGPGNGKGQHPRRHPPTSGQYDKGILCARDVVESRPGGRSFLREWLHPSGGDKTSTGLTGEYFNNITFAGTPAVTRLDKDINFQWTLSAPADEINHDFYSARWTGTLRAPRTGRYRIGLDGDDGYRLYLDGQLVIDNWKKQSYHSMLSEFSFEQGHDYSIRVEFFEPVGNAHLKLIWNVDTKDDWQEKIEEAVKTAQQADIAIVTVGIIEAEFF